MQDKQLLIVGIDPGTTLGYSVLDIDSGIIEVGSSKLFNFDSLVAKLTSLGKVVIIGTDKRKVPAFIDRLRRKLGAKLITPPKDLKKKEKSSLAFGYKVRNTHEKDALSSAIFSYNKLKPLLNKIDSFLNICNKRKYSSAVKELLLIENNLNISSALQLAESSMLKKRQKSAGNIFHEIEKPASFIKKEDFDAFKKRNTRLEKDLKLLRNHTVSLKDELAKCKKNLQLLEYKKLPILSNKKAKEIMKFRGKRIYCLSSQIESMKKENLFMKDKIEQIYSFLSNLNENILLKKLDTLSWLEFSKKNKVLNIMHDDILLVENPNIISNKTLDSLKDIVNVIIHRQDISRKLKDNLGFIFINSKELEITENELFGSVNKKMFDKLKNNKELLNTIIKEYKNKKEDSLS